MNELEIKKCALALQRNLRWMHRLLDNTPELDDDKYLQIVRQINNLRLDLFSALAMVGVAISVTERESAPDISSRVIGKRQWKSSSATDSNTAPAVQSPQTNPFSSLDWN